MKHNNTDNSTEWFRGPARGRTVAAMALLVVTALMLWGCPEEIEEQDLDPDAVDEDAELDLEYDSSQGFGEDESYSRPSYAQRRNPFRPDTEVLSIGEQEEEEVDQDRDRDDIEKYDIDSLELVSTISQTAVPRAMFVDPTGLGHFVNEGDRIGTEGGVVRDIRQEEVDIQESDGEVMATRTVALREAEDTRPRGTELTEEEREALRQIVEQEREGPGDEVADDRMEEIDDRFPGLQPPENQ